MHEVHEVVGIPEFLSEAMPDADKVSGCVQFQLCPWNLLKITPEMRKKHIFLSYVFGVAGKDFFKINRFANDHGPWLVDQFVEIADGNNRIHQLR